MLAIDGYIPLFIYELQALGGSVCSRPRSFRYIASPDVKKLTRLRKRAEGDERRELARQVPVLRRQRKQSLGNVHSSYLLMLEASSRL